MIFFLELFQFLNLFSFDLKVELYICQLDMSRRFIKRIAGNQEK